MVATRDAKKVFGRPQALTDVPTRYCPGCGHGIVHRLIAELIDEFGLRERTIGVTPIGCAIYAWDYFNFDVVEAAHGRAPAVATGVKRTNPDKFVFCYQGDGDIAAIGTAEMVHAAARGERICLVFVNNATYGMTGGQMAPTTLPGQRTTSTQSGRDVVKAGYPLRVPEMLSALDGPVFLARAAVNSPANVGKAKALLKKAFRAQLDGLGFSLVEVLSPCPTDWGLRPVDALKWVSDNMIKYYPLGEIKVAPELK
ncbi:MAG: thiamine pyrophosphate-dependent enzyme [Chloroflexi bacterium]|nr:thiamine pyrophosphate-dependent enzyme [Chloroflexota bacterium]